ncbi:hypothetical protein DOY81_008762, partial [Sarcophaga bullata]
MEAQRRKNGRMERRKNKLFVEKYFKVVNNRAACRLCTHTLKSDRTFNLKVHIKKVHNIELDVFKNRVHRLNETPSEHKINIPTPICRGLTAKNEQFFSLNSDRCKEALKLVADNIRKDVKDGLKHKFLSLKVDTLVRNNDYLQHFVLFKAQYFEDDAIHGCLLGIEEVEHENNLPAKIDNILAKYDIKPEQIITITMEQGLLHRHTLGCTDTEPPECTDASKILFHDIELQPYISHIIQVCALDVHRDCHEVQYFLRCCRDLVKFIQDPFMGYMDLLEDKNFKIPQLDCVFKWDSTFFMIADVKNAKDVLHDVYRIKNEFSDGPIVLHDNFWDMVEAYCIAFEPLRYITEKFQFHSLHYGDFYAEWLKCRIYTEKINTGQHSNRHVRIIAATLLQKMEDRTLEMLKNEIFVACLYLDPRFNHTLTAMQKLAAISYLKKLYEKISTKTANETKNLESSDDKHKMIENFNELSDKLLQEYLTRNFVTPSSSGNYNAFAKIENLQLPFQRVDTNVLLFWKQKQSMMPELYNLSKICFAMPATQLSMEQIMSSVTNTVDKESGRIDKALLESIVLVKLNPFHLDEAIDKLPLFD